MPTILKTPEGYVYKRGGAAITDQSTLDYLAKLVIPPAWRDVEIYYGARPKILYMGWDAKDRPQFVYAQWWVEQQRSIKLCNLIPFGEMLPLIQSDIAKSLRQSGRWTKNKIAALVLRIISLCYFRVGNLKYEEQNASHGITTLSREHITIDAGGVHFKFIGKKAQLNECVCVDPLVKDRMRELLDLKSQDPHVFRYQAGQSWYHISHLDINDYLKAYNPQFTSKMFRTMDTNTMLIQLLSEDPGQLTVSARKREVVKALKQVSAVVHNTAAVCKKDYADPDIIRLYLEKPRSYKKWFLTPTTSPRIRFINFLKSKCSLQIEKIE